MRLTFLLTGTSSIRILNTMVNSSHAGDGRRQRHVDSIFQALADPTRRRILVRLSSAGEGAVTDLAKPFRISLPAISRHLRVLERAKLIGRKRNGRVHMIHARAQGLKPAQDWIAQYIAHWDRSFDKLDELLRIEMNKDKEI
jgi:DNA-binding transcriptional ArsR family regulator